VIVLRLDCPSRDRVNPLEDLRGDVGELKSATKGIGILISVQLASVVQNSIFAALRRVHSQGLSAAKIEF
jgi:hypothetical protein